MQRLRESVGTKCHVCATSNHSHRATAAPTVVVPYFRMSLIRVTCVSARIIALSLSLSLMSERQSAIVQTLMLPLRSFNWKKRSIASLCSSQLSEAAVLIIAVAVCPFDKPVRALFLRKHTSISLISPRNQVLGER